jgi:hypothetical protein
MRGTRWLFVGGIICGGCLDPLVEDEPTASLNVLPPFTEVPAVASHPVLERQIRINDGISDSLVAMGGAVPLRNGFAKGTAIRYWDLGDAPQTFAQIYVLYQADGTTRLDHPPIVDTVPGDTGYSPFRLVQNVVVTDTYKGQVIPSFEALNDAVDMGIVLEPTPPEMPMWIDGPVVQVGAKLDTGPGQAPVETFPVYAHGYKTHLLPVGGAAAFRPLARAGRLPRGDAHRITVGNAVNPVPEPTFQNAPSNWTPGVRIIECTVNPIEPVAPVANEGELFTRDMMGNLVSSTDRVRTWRITTTNKHWPLYEEPAPAETTP